MPPSSLDFIHGTDIVDRGLMVLLFGLFLLFSSLFSVAPSSFRKRLNSAILVFFGYCFDPFSVTPLSLEIFLSTPLQASNPISRLTFYKYVCF